MPEMDNHGMPGRDDNGTATPFFQRLTIFFGICTVIISFLGLASIHWNLGIYRFFYPGYKTIAFSAAIIWIVFGLVLAFQAKKPFLGRIRACILAVIAVIAIFALIEFTLQLLGQPFIVETWVYQFGNAILAYPTTSISPVASGLIIPSSLALFLLVYAFGLKERARDARNAVGILGLFVSLISFTFLLSYIYGIPFLYQTTILPVAPDSVIALLLIGAGLITAVGSDALPLKYFTGTSTKAHLLRVFFPLVIILIFAQSFLQVTLSSVYHLNSAITMALFLIAVIIVMTYIVGKASGSLGKAIDSAEQQRRAVEIALYKSEKRYELILDATNDGLWDWDIPTGTAIFSPRWYTMLGYEPHEMPGNYTTFRELVHPEDLDLVEATIQNHIRLKDEGYSVEMRMKTKSGTWKWILTRGKVIERDAEDKPVRMVGTHTDITERKVAEALRAAAEEQYRALFENVSIGILRSTPEPHGAIIEANPAAIRIFEADSREQLLAVRPSDLYPDADQRRIVSDEIVAKGGIEGMEVRYKTLKGKPIWGRITAIKKTSETGEIYFDNTIEDITERKRAEEALKESEIRFRTILDQASDAIIIHDIHGRIVNVNQKTCQNLGYTKDELLSMSISEIDPEAIESGKDHIWQEIILGQNVSFESQEKRKDGTTFPVEITLGPIKLENEILIIGIVRDITERRKAEAALRESEELFKGVAERSSDLILLVDKGGIATYVSPSVERILGYLPREIVGKTPEDFIIPDDITTVWEGVNKSVSGENVGGVTVHSRKKSGEYAIMEMTTSPIIKEDRISGIQVIARDITERKRAEHQRELLISELEQKNAELERFTYTVSHDLKSPIITIRGFLGLLAEDAKKGDINQMDSDILRIFSATDKMQALLDDLLAHSRIGRIVNPPERINFGTIAEEAVEQLAGVIRQHSITITIAPDLPEVFVDHTRIREVLVNLIENAIKFRGDQPVPTIEIGMRCDESEPVFFVKDNGIGIEEPYTKKIFGLFEKLDAKTEGTGVGLAIVKRIIEVHGGKIWAESPGLGLGSTFCFTLPVTGSKCIYTPEKGKRDE